MVSGHQRQCGSRGPLFSTSEKGVQSLKKTQLAEHSLKSKRYLSTHTHAPSLRSQEKKVSADTIQDLEMRRLSWVIGAGAKCHRKCSCKRRGRGRVPHTQRGDVKTEAESTVMWHHAKECQQKPPEAGRGKEQVTPGASRGSIHLLTF